MTRMYYIKNLLQLAPEAVKCIIIDKPHQEYRITSRILFFYSFRIRDNMIQINVILF